MSKHILFFSWLLRAICGAAFGRAKLEHVCDLRDEEKAARLQGLGITPLMLDGAPLSPRIGRGQPYCLIDA